MNIKNAVCGVMLGLGMAVVCCSGIAQADTTLTPNYVLKTKGLDMRNSEIVSISPDNRFLCCLKRKKPVRGKKSFNTIYILPIENNGNLGNVREFVLEETTFIGNLAFTPDSRFIVATDKNGSRFTKIDCSTGEISTLMEHVSGKGGFKLYPPVLEHSDGKLLALGYHYNSQDFAGPNAIVQLDADKEGLEAFKDARLIDHVQVATREKDKDIREIFPSLDVGFIASYDDNVCHIVSWDGERGTTQIEDCKTLVDMVASDTRAIYSIQDKDETYRLCIYDAKTDEKVTLDSGRNTPHYYVLMSSDGKTVVFSDKVDEGERYITYYARESEGWKIKPIKGLEKRFAFGRQRLSCDGTKMAFHNDDGIRICDLTDK